MPSQCLCVTSERSCSCLCNRWNYLLMFILVVLQDIWDVGGTTFYEKQETRRESLMTHVDDVCAWISILISDSNLNFLYCNHLYLQLRESNRDRWGRIWTTKSLMTWKLYSCWLTNKRSGRLEKNNSFCKMSKEGSFSRLEENCLNAP